jgi:hypothetical protein
MPRLSKENALSTVFVFGALLDEQARSPQDFAEESD